MSSASKIGECPICFSTLTSSNIFAITKCGHTFHQSCINQWITNAKTCPTCRTSASENDVIKLFIQGCPNIATTTTTTTATEKQLNYTKTQYSDFFHYLITKCKCEAIRDNNGDLQYKGGNGFNVNIQYRKTNGSIKVILQDGYIITTFPSTKLKILRERTKGESIVNSDGERIEYFYQGIRNGKETFNVRCFNTRNLKGREYFITDRSNERAKHDRDEINFYCPGFNVKRSLKNGDSGAVIVKVLSSTDSEKFLKIVICPQHEIFCVKHYDGNDQYGCTFSGKTCEHF